MMNRLLRLRPWWLLSVAVAAGLREWLALCRCRLVSDRAASPRA
jgi:hypothetical protein